MTDATRIVAAAERWAEWDRFVARSSESTFAHRAGWAGIVRDVFGHECEYLVAEDVTGAWRGVLPLVHVRGLLGHHLISMPFLNDGGPLGADPIRGALARSAIDRARESRARVLEIRSRIAIPDAPPGAARKVAVHLDLPSTVDELWASTFKAKLRSQIRRPSRDGMTSRGGLAELESFYHVFSRNMRDLGTPVLPRAFFQRLAAEFGDDVVFTTIYSSQGVPAAAACCLIWRTEMEITWASSVRDFNPSSPNMLLYASVMEAAIGRGIGRFNFGRSTPNAPTHRFKQQWGGRDVPLPWLTWPDEPAHADGPGALMRTAIAVWRRLPLAVANRIGPRISGQLPW